MDFPKERDVDFVEVGTEEGFAGEGIPAFGDDLSIDVVFECQMGRDEERDIVAGRKVVRNQDDFLNLGTNHTYLRIWSIISSGRSVKRGILCGKLDRFVVWNQGLVCVRYMRMAEGSERSYHYCGWLQVVQ